MAAPPQWMSPVAEEERLASRLSASRLRAGDGSCEHLDAPGERVYDESHVIARLRAARGADIAYDDDDDRVAVWEVQEAPLRRARTAASARLRAIRRAEALERVGGPMGAGPEDTVARQRSNVDMFGIRRGRMEARFGFPTNKHSGLAKHDPVDTTCVGFLAPRVHELRAAVTIRDDNGNEVIIDLRRFCARCGYPHDMHESEAEAGGHEVKAARTRIEHTRERLQGCTTGSVVGSACSLAATPPSLAEVHAMGVRELRELLAADSVSCKGITERSELLSKAITVVLSAGRCTSRFSREVKRQAHGDVSGEDDAWMYVQGSDNHDPGYWHNRLTGEQTWNDPSKCPPACPTALVAGAGGARDPSQTAMPALPTPSEVVSMKVRELKALLVANGERVKAAGATEKCELVEAAMSVVLRKRRVAVR